MPVSKEHQNERPFLFIAGYLDGANKKDAIQYVKNLMVSMCAALDDSGYLVMPYLDGFAYEIQEGGHRHSYLKWIIDAVSGTDKEKVTFRTAAHAVSVEKTPKGLITLFIPESGISSEVIEQPTHGVALTRYAVDKTKYVSALMYLFGFSCVVLVAAAVIKTAILIAKSDAEKQQFAIKISQAPVLQWPKNRPQDNTYIEQITYKNGKWNTISKPMPTVESSEEGSAEVKTSAANPTAKAEELASKAKEAANNQNKKGIEQVPVIVDGAVINKPINNQEPVNATK